MASPLDKLPAALPTGDHGKPPAGRLRLHLQPQTESPHCRTAKVTLEVISGAGPVYFTGTRAREVRPGFVTLEIPALEQWSAPLQSLAPAQRQRFEDAEFYELLQREISRRLLLLPRTPG